MEILAQLGIDWKMFLAQIFNFLILLWVLKRFAYPPIINMLEERTKRIEKGLEDAKESARKLAEISDQEKQVLAEARESAGNLLKDAESMAKRSQEMIMQKAKEEAEHLIIMTEKRLAAEKTNMVNEAKAELVDIVLVAMEKVLREKLDEAKDQELIRKALHTSK